MNPLLSFRALSGPSSIATAAQSGYRFGSSTLAMSRSSTSRVPRFGGEDEQAVQALLLDPLLTHYVAEAQVECSSLESQSVQTDDGHLFTYPQDL